MVVITNPRAGGGRAHARWDGLADMVRGRLGEFELVRMSPGVDLLATLGLHLEHGQREFVAAGGDGTVNAVLQALMGAAAPAARKELCLGAIGLGSSNDFHKPGSAPSSLGGCPCRLDFASATPRDVGVLDYCDEGGASRRRFWLLNASVGVTAEANLFFNHPDPLLAALKRTHTSTAIAYAALRTLAQYRAQSVTVSSGGASRSLAITSLGVAKSPHFSGHLCYSTPFEPASGDFYVHVAGDRSLRGWLRALWGLSHGGERATLDTASWRTSTLEVRMPQPVAVEFDGEVVQTSAAAFHIQPQAIRVCQR